MSIVTTGYSRYLLIRVYRKLEYYLIFVVGISLSPAPLSLLVGYSLILAAVAYLTQIAPPMTTLRNTAKPLGFG